MPVFPRFPDNARGLRKPTLQLRKARCWPRKRKVSRLPAGPALSVSTCRRNRAKRTGRATGRSARPPPTRSVHADAGGSSATFSLQPGDKSERRGLAHECECAAGLGRRGHPAAQRCFPHPAGGHAGDGPGRQPKTRGFPGPCPRRRSRRPRHGNEAASFPRTPPRVQPEGALWYTSKYFSSRIDRLQPFDEGLRPGRRRGETPGPVTVREKAAEPVITDHT